MFFWDYLVGFLSFFEFIPLIYNSSVLFPSKPWDKNSYSTIHIDRSQKFCLLCHGSRSIRAFVILASRRRAREQQALGCLVLADI